MKKSSKPSQNNEFWPKTWSHQISLIFGHHALNPFDTEHRDKTAVKFGILRVVMLWILPPEKQVTVIFGGGYWTCHQMAIEDC